MTEAYWRDGNNELRAVEVNTAPAGMLSSLNIAGLMARMYDIVRNVVIPARISVRTVVLAGLNPIIS